MCLEKRVRCDINDVFPACKDIVFDFCRPVYPLITVICRQEAMPAKLKLLFQLYAITGKLGNGRFVTFLCMDVVFRTDRFFVVFGQILPRWAKYRFRSTTTG